MAERKIKKKTKAEEEPKILPVPPTLLNHHLQQLNPVIQKWRESQKVPPVLLLTGPTGIGKKSLVYYLAQLLTCDRTGFSAAPDDPSEMSLFGESPEPQEVSPLLEQPCGECSNCIRALKNSWLEFHVFEPEKLDTGKQGTIKIHDFDELKRKLGFGSHDEDFRVALIHHAEALTPQAANSLLKTLEEPPPGWVFFLTTSDPSLLLPTLVSRCQVIRLKPLEEIHLRKLLEDSEVPEQRIDTAVRISKGSLSRAIAITEDENWERREEILQFLNTPSIHYGPLVDWASSQANHMDLLLDLLEQILFELMLDREDEGSNSDKILKQYKFQAKARFKKTHSLMEHWTSCSSKLQYARKVSQAPLNRKLLAQEILSPWLLV